MQASQNLPADSGRHRRTHLVWVVLMLATLVTYWLGESGTTESHGMRAVQIMFALVVLKGALVIDEFMGLRRAPSLWRWGFMGWLTGVVSLIVLAYWLGTLWHT